jgi:hypothetical protein
MKIMGSLAVGAAFFVGGLFVAVAPASAAGGPQPPTCYGASVNDGQAATTVHGFLGVNGQPGLSGAGPGGVAAFLVTARANCGF